MALAEEKWVKKRVIPQMFWNKLNFVLFLREGGGKRKRERTNLICPSNEKYFYLSIRLVTNSVICIYEYIGTHIHILIQLYTYTYMCIYVYVKKKAVNPIAL